MVLNRLIGHGWGSLEISLASQGHDLGGTVDGLVRVDPKRDIGPGRLELALVCVEATSRTAPSAGHGRRRRPAGLSVSFGTSRGGLQRQTTRTEVFRHDRTLDHELRCTQGVASEHPFRLPLPATDQQNQPDPAAPGWATDFIRVFNAVTFSDKRLEWAVQARFRNPDGFDLRASAPLTVNTRF